MKKVLIGLLVALMAASSFAGILVMWDTGGFLSGTDGNPYVFDSDDESTTKLVWDLVYTTDSSITTPVLNETTGEITYGENDKIVSQRIATLGADGKVNAVITDIITSSQVSVSPQEMDAGGYLGDSSTYQNTQFPYSSGGLYAAVFQYTSNNTVYYAMTDLVTEVNWANDGSATPTDVNFDLSVDTQLEKLGSFTPVPEPATMSLLGLGALAMVLRRKLRK